MYDYNSYKKFILKYQGSKFMTFNNDKKNNNNNNNKQI